MPQYCTLIHQFCYLFHFLGKMQDEFCRFDSLIVAKRDTEMFIYSASRLIGWQILKHANQETYILTRLVNMTQESFFLTKQDGDIISLMLGIRNTQKHHNSCLYSLVANCRKRSFVLSRYWQAIWLMKVLVTSARRGTKVVG